MNRMLAVALIGLVGLGLSGCPKRPTTKPAPGTSQSVPSAGASTGAAGTEDGRAQALLGNGSQGAGGIGGVGGTIIYFDFDSAEIRPEYSGVIATQAKRLAQGGNLRLRLEGNTDERGSPEYNIGLGERRAQAVKKALILQGARADQLVTVSYGQERPAVEGHSEDAWAKNRRVEIIALNP